MVMTSPLSVPYSEGARSLCTSMLTGEQSQVLTIVGDSTSDEADEWPYVIGQRFAKTVSRIAVSYHLWSDSAQDHLPPVMISTGRKGERHIVFAGGGQKARYLAPALIGEITNDLDVRVDVALDDWTPAADVSLGGRWGSGTNKSWRIRVLTTGALSIEFTADGSAITTATSSATLGSVGVVDGQRVRLKFELDVDNGASGKSVKFYYQFIGSTTWTQLGVTQTSATAIAALNQPASSNYEIGGTQSATSVISGKLYGFSIRNGIAGPRLSPVTLEGWANEEIASPLGGSPTLHIYNGSASGQGFTYFNNSTRFPKMVPGGNYPLLFISTGHNQNELGSDLITACDAFQALVDARAPCAQIAALVQNPRISPAAVEQKANQAETIARRFVKKGGVFVDTRLPMIRDRRGLSSLIEPAGVHPIAAGKKVQADAVWQMFAPYL